MKKCSIINWCFNFQSATWGSANVGLEQCEFSMAKGYNDKINILLEGFRCGSYVDSCYFHDICTKHIQTSSLFDYCSGLQITNSRFENIVKEKNGSWFIVIARDSDIFLKDCQFINCIGGSSEGLFWRCNIVKNENCMFENCAPLT